MVRDCVVEKHRYLLEYVNIANTLMCQNIEILATGSKLPSHFLT